MKNLSYENLVSLKMQDLSNIGSDIRNIFMLGQTLRATVPDLIDLSLGNPDLDPPSIVKEKLKDLANESEAGMHRYMDGAGLLDVREFIAKECSISENIEITAEQVFLTVGAAGGLQILMRAFLEPNDEVIIFSPYFPEYLSYSHHLHAKPVIVHSDENHIPDVCDLENKITDKTKLVIINSPNNPSGVCYPQEKLVNILNIIRNASNKYNKIIPVISDEPYMRLLYSLKPIRMLRLYPHIFIVRSLSKDLGLAGERIGYFIWNQKSFPNINLINTFRNAARVAGFVSAPRIMQRLIPSILNAKVDIDIYKKRIEAFLAILKQFNIECVVPDAGFFVFPKLKNNWDDKLLCEKLAQNGVLCVPGSAFGKPGFLRASLTQDIEQIKNAAKIFCCVYHSYDENNVELNST